MITYHANAGIMTLGRIGNYFYGSSASSYGTFKAGVDFSSNYKQSGLFAPNVSPTGSTFAYFGENPDFTTCYCYDRSIPSMGRLERDYTLDRLSTSRVRAFGDHDCCHYKINANLVSPGNRRYVSLPDIFNPKSPIATQPKVSAWRMSVHEAIGGKQYFPLESGFISIPVNLGLNIAYRVRYTLEAGEDPYPFGLSKYTVQKPLYIEFVWILQTDKVAKYTPNTTYTYRIACSAHANFMAVGTSDTTFANTESEIWTTAEATGFISRACIQTSSTPLQDVIQNVIGSLGSTKSRYYTFVTPQGVKKTGGSLTAQANANLGTSWKLGPLVNFDAVKALNTKRLGQYFTTGNRADAINHANQPILFDPSVSPAKMRLARDYLYANYARFWDTCPLPCDTELGDVAILAAQQAKSVDINSIAYLKDIPGYILQLKTVLKVLKSGVSPVSALSQAFNPKTWASLYLFKKWGVDLTVDDTKELIAAIGTSVQKARQTLIHEYSVVNARTMCDVQTRDNFLVKRTTCYKLYYQPYEKGFLGLLKKLQDWDVYPTWENMWDLIPFSFVIDWFVNVQQLLDNWDTVNYYQYLNIKSTVWSAKDICVRPNVVLDGVEIRGMSLVRYKRQVRPSPHLPSFRLEKTSGPFNNELELTAIIAQRF